MTTPSSQPIHAVYIKRYTISDLLDYFSGNLVDIAMDEDDAPSWVLDEGVGSVEYNFQSREFVVTIKHEENGNVETKQG